MGNGSDRYRQDQETLTQLNSYSGTLVRRIIERAQKDLPWVNELSKEDRNWIGPLAQAGVENFLKWCANPSHESGNSGDIFRSAPHRLARSISLQRTLSLVRLVVEVVESEAVSLVSASARAALTQAILAYSREVAFSAAETYARAAEVRGAWDARMEAQVVDAMRRGDLPSELQSRLSALGWADHGSYIAIIGSSPQLGKQRDLADIRRTCHRAGADVVAAVHGDQLVAVIGAKLDARTVALEVEPIFGPGPVVLGHAGTSVADISDSLESALNGAVAVRAWVDAPRPVDAAKLYPERVLAGDPQARAIVINSIYNHLIDTDIKLVDTVDSYLRVGRSVEASARDLGLHSNTVRYRLARVEKITGLDPMDARDAYVLRVAFAVARLGHHPVL